MREVVSNGTELGCGQLRGHLHVSYVCARPTEERPATPTMITDDAEIACSYVSRALNNLHKHGSEVWETIETRQFV